MNNTTDETRLNNAGANNESLQGFIVGANKRYLPFIQYTPTFEDTDYEAKEITFAYTYGQIVALNVEGSNEHTDLKLQATLYFKIDEPENILAGYLSNLQYNGISNSHIDIYFWYNGETIKIGFIGQYNTFTVSARILNPEENKTGVIVNILIRDAEIPDTDSNKYAEGSITSNTEGLIPKFNNLNIYTESNDLPDFIYSPTSSEDTTIDLRPYLPGSIDIEQTFDYTEGAYNTYNVIAKNGSIIGTFKVRNGTKGDQGNPGVQGNTGAQGPKGASGEQGHPIFFTADYPMNIEGAVKGDILVYMGEDTSIGKIGDVFKLINIDTVEEEGEEIEVQRWAYQGYNLRGPQGEILNAEGIIPVFRLVNVTDADYPPMSYQKLQMSFDSFQNIIELGELRCRSIRTIYQVQGLTDEDTYYTFRIEYTDGTNYDLKITPNGTSKGFKVMVVSVLPPVGEEGTIYLVPSSDPEERNYFNEYIYTTTSEQDGQPVYSWELIGSTRVNIAESLQEGANIKLETTEDNKVEISAIGYTYNSLTDSYAQGKYTEAVGISTHAEGKDTLALGNGSHSEGLRRNAFGAYSHAEGAADAGSGSTDVRVVEEEELTSFEAVGSSEPYKVNIQISNGSVDPSITNYESILLFYQDGYVNPSDQAVITNYESKTKNKITTITLTLDKKIADLHWSLANSEKITLCTPPQDKALSYGTFSHAEGFNTSSIGIGSHVEGDTTVALGDYAHAEGSGSIANGSVSHVEGRMTITYNDGEHAEGKYNHSTSSDSFISTIGVGYDENTRKNARVIDSSGNCYLLRVGGYAGGSINDTTLALSVQNLIGHLSKVTSIDNTYQINGDSEIYVRTISGTTEADRTVTFKNPNHDRVVTCSIIFNNISGSTITPVFKSAASNNVLRIMTDIESIPTASIAEYVCTYISAFGWVINGGTQKNVIQPNNAN